MEIDDIINRINFLLDFNKWSMYKLAKEANLPYSSICNIFHRKSFPSLVTLDKICKGFNISLSEFFDYNSNPLRDITLNESEQNLLNTYRKLSSYDRMILNAYADGIISSKGRKDSK